MDLRIGQGYDIHKLEKNGKRLIIGNCHIPFEKGLKAHSDGDVLIHAIIDAILGAANLGDIGTLFPDNDPKYKDIDSGALLKETLGILRDNSFEIVNLDSTIICERPKMKEYIPEIKEKLSSLIGIEVEKISIKAKTKEKLDSVGREKAIEVFSVCLIKKI
ncbi:MAG TPA: 2-C-methyl-D-erythritol 2,4-cyclodiphosphate synthase [Spirochaetota bacterium]|nr:2-C-methyl-D-erythritol 2,4-cyclodiphosphate synthase [Spirochaetota bacterium]